MKTGECVNTARKFGFFPIWAGLSVVAIGVVSLASWDASDVFHSALALIAAVTGMMYTMLAGRGRISCYVFGFINAPLYAYLSYRWGYYGDMALNIYYFVMMFPGLVCWKRNMSTDVQTKGIVRTQLCLRERLVWGGVILLCTVVLWQVLRLIGGSRPFCDALTNVLSVAAMVLTVKRCIEQWVMWITVDAVEVFMWWHTGETSMALLAMWVLFLVDGIYLFWLWIDDLRRQKQV